MGRAILVRHGRTTANASGVLAGRTAVELDEHGRDQAARLAEVFAGVPLAAAVSSPLLRTQQTLELLLGARAADVPVHLDDALTEVDYGEWTGGALKDLAQDPLWRLVQSHPASVTFPGGESMAAMAARSAAAVRGWVAQLDAAAAPAAVAAAPAAVAASKDAAAETSPEQQPGAAAAAPDSPAAPPSNVLIVSHGDVIKAILADALGMHLDAFQRIAVDPASVSVVHFVGGRPMVECMNTDGSLLRTWQMGDPTVGEAAPGGGAGR